MFNNNFDINTGYAQPGNNLDTNLSFQNPSRVIDPSSRRFNFGDDNYNCALSQVEEHSVPTLIPPGNSRRYDYSNNGGNKNVFKRMFYSNDGIHFNLIEETSNGKVKTTPLTNAFSIGNVTYITEIGDTQIKYVHIAGGTERPYCSIITYEDYMNERFYQHMKWVRRCPGCTKKQVNDLLYDQIQKAPKSEANLFSRQGFIKIGDNEYTFGSYPKNMEAYAKIMSDSVKMKKLAPLYRETQEITQRWLDIYASHLNLKFIGLISIAAKLQFLLEENSVKFKPIFVVSPAGGLNEEQLKAMLYSFDIKNSPIPLLSLSEKGILSYLKNIWDSLAVFWDNSFSDEAAKIENPLRTLIKASRDDYGEECAGRSIIAIISGNAGYLARRISPESVIPLSMEGVTLDYSSAHISEVTSEMESLVVKKILSRLPEIRSLVAYVTRQSEFCSDKNLTAEVKEGFIYLMAAEAFLKHILGVNLATNEEIIQLVQDFDTQRNALIDSDTAIVRDFAKITSEYFRTGRFKAIRKKNGMVINTNCNTAVISGNRVFFTGEMIAEVLSQMATTHNMKALMNSLAHYNALDERDGRTHPLDAHSSGGEAVRLYLYDISADILDEDVIYTLNNLESEAYMLSKQEIPQKAFLQLLRVGNGRVAGKLFVYDDVENDSIAIYGQAGEGKSYTKAQIMASRFSLDYDILVFDTGDSDTYEALCKNLSKKFVDENIIFHSLDDKNFNIDIFNTDRTVSLLTQQKEVTGVIVAGVRNLSIPQTNALRSAVSEQIEITDPDKSISSYELLRALNKEGTTNESLRNRLEPFINGIQAYGLTQGTWKDFFSGEHKIHVVQASDGFSGNGNQIVDALLAVLFNYKRENPQRPLSVFIDEVQNHNLSDSSPIRKILKEGRKYHLSIVAATQDFYARRTEIGSALGKAGMQIHHRPTQDSANLVAAELRWNKADMIRFDSMDRGDIIVKGALYNKEKGRNMHTTLSGHIDNFQSGDIVDESNEDVQMTEDDC